MDLPGQLVILAVLVLFLALFSMGSMENSLPYFTRIRFDNICNSYLLVIQKNGGLSVAERNNLEGELTDIGFENIRVTAPDNAPWGQRVTLEVKADYVFQETKADFTKEEDLKTATYKNTTVIMTLN